MTQGTSKSIKISALCMHALSVLTSLWVGQLQLKQMRQCKAVRIELLGSDQQQWHLSSPV